MTTYRLLLAAGLALAPAALALGVLHGRAAPPVVADAPRTPRVLNPHVTQATIASTICPRRLTKSSGGDRTGHSCGPCRADRRRSRPHPRLLATRDRIARARARERARVPGRGRGTRTLRRGARSRSRPRAHGALPRGAPRA